jgi:hypothetical protein
MAAAPPGVAVAIASVGSLEIAALLFPGAAVNAPVEHLWIAVPSAVVGSLWIAAAAVVAGPPETVAVIFFGASSPGRPRYFSFPSVCSFPSCASSVGPADAVFAGDPMGALSSDAPGSHLSNSMAFPDKKTEHFDSRPIQNHSFASDTIALPTDATTNPRRKRSPYPGQGQNRHSSQGL